MRISIIVVIDKDGGIGYRNTVPWMGKVPRDMKHFRALTMGHPVIMGRNTYIAMGAALPGRTNIVLSTDKTLTLPDARVVHSPEEALDVCHGVSGNDEVFVIGGAQIYEVFIPMTERMYITEVKTPFTCDTYFPDYAKEDWEMIGDELFAPNDKNLFPVRFVTLQKAPRSATL
jgi:dihydrofolate reductase